MSDIILGTPGLDTPGQPSGLAGLGYDQSEVGDWVTLLKPRVISLVVLTGVVGLMVAPGRLPAALAIAAVLCIALGAGAAGAINMWYDRDIDARMKRTATRPIPAGRIPAGAALGYGITLAVASIVIMGLATNWVAAAVLAVSIGFYVFVYTMWLKRRTPQNIVIGGAAGAFPPVIGWAAVTGDIAWPPVVLFAIIFLWTPPHFWALSLFAHADYERVGVPMLPVTHGARETRRQVLLYTLVLVPFTFVPCLMHFAGWIYGAAASLLGGIFLWHAWLVWTDRQDAAGRSLDGDKRARKAFRYSLSYLGLLFIALAVDHMMLAN